MNGNSNLDIAVMYQNMGSGSFKSFYFYEWNGENFEVKLHNSNLLFPASYTEWLRDKELEPVDSSDFYNSHQNQDTIEINNCLKEKAVLNSQGIFADVEDCYLGY